MNQKTEHLLVGNQNQYSRYRKNLAQIERHVASSEKSVKDVCERLSHVSRLLLENIKRRNDTKSMIVKAEVKIGETVSQHSKTKRKLASLYTTLISLSSSGISSLNFDSSREVNYFDSLFWKVCVFNSFSETSHHDSISIHARLFVIRDWDLEISSIEKRGTGSLCLSAWLPLCPYDLLGECNERNCNLQHTKSLTERDYRSTYCKRRIWCAQSVLESHQQREAKTGLISVHKNASARYFQQQEDDSEPNISIPFDTDIVRHFMSHFGVSIQPRASSSDRCKLFKMLQRSFFTVCNADQPLIQRLLSLVKSRLQLDEAARANESCWIAYLTLLTQLTKNHQPKETHYLLFERIDSNFQTCAPIQVVFQQLFPGNARNGSQFRLVQHLDSFCKKCHHEYAVDTLCALLSLEPIFNPAFDAIERGLGVDTLAQSLSGQTPRQDRQWQLCSLLVLLLTGIFQGGQLMHMDGNSITCSTYCMLQPVKFESRWFAFLQRAPKFRVRFENILKRSMQELCGVTLNIIGNATLDIVLGTAVDEDPVRVSLQSSRKRHRVSSFSAGNDLADDDEEEEEKEKELVAEDVEKEVMRPGEQGRSRRVVGGRNCSTEDDDDDDVGDVDGDGQQSFRPSPMSMCSASLAAVAVWAALKYAQAAGLKASPAGVRVLCGVCSPLLFPEAYDTSMGISPVANASEVRERAGRDPRLAMAHLLLQSDQVGPTTSSSLSSSSSSAASSSSSSSSSSSPPSRDGVVLLFVLDAYLHGSTGFERVVRRLAAVAPTVGLAAADLPVGIDKLAGCTAATGAPRDAVLSVTPRDAVLSVTPRVAVLSVTPRVAVHSVTTFWNIDRLVPASQHSSTAFVSLLVSWIAFGRAHKLFNLHGSSGGGGGSGGDGSGGATAGLGGLGWGVTESPSTRYQEMFTRMMHHADLPAALTLRYVTAFCREALVHLGVSAMTSLPAEGSMTCIGVDGDANGDEDDSDREEREMIESSSSLPANSVLVKDIIHICFDAVEESFSAASTCNGAMYWPQWAETMGPLRQHLALVHILTLCAKFSVIEKQFLGAILNRCLENIPSPGLIVTWIWAQAHQQACTDSLAISLAEFLSSAAQTGISSTVVLKSFSSELLFDMAKAALNIENVSAVRDIQAALGECTDCFATLYQNILNEKLIYEANGGGGVGVGVGGGVDDKGNGASEVSAASQGALSKRGGGKKSRATMLESGNSIYVVSSAPTARHHVADSQSSGSRSAGVDSEGDRGKSVSLRQRKLLADKERSIDPAAAGAGGESAALSQQGEVLISSFAPQASSSSCYLRELSLDLSTLDTACLHKLHKCFTDVSTTPTATATTSTTTAASSSSNSRAANSRTSVSQRAPASIDLSGYFSSTGELSLDAVALLRDSSVRELALRNNQLSALPPCILFLTALKLLDLSWNALQLLPTQLANSCPNITVLRLSNNRFKVVPLVIVELKKLEEISLDHNFVEYIPPEMLRLKYLTSFDISNNLVKSVPNGFGSNVRYFRV